MIKIAICDDENTIVNKIEQILLRICRQRNIDVDIDIFYSGTALEKEVVGGTRYDLIYMDIEMKNGNGIEAATNIRKVDENVMLIYVSAYDRYALELFRLDVFSFIKKPMVEEKFVGTFLEAYDRMVGRMVYFTFRNRREEYKIPCRDILYFASIGRKISVIHRDGTIDEYYGKLSEVEEKVSGGKIPFLRIHQSYLINFLWVKSRTKSEVTLINGTRLMISEDRQKTFVREYSDLLGGEIDV